MKNFAACKELSPLPLPQPIGFGVYPASSQARGTNSTSFPCVRNEVELVPLACEDVYPVGFRLPAFYKN